MPEIASESHHFQCRHIFTEGRRCGSKCLRDEPLCYYHHTTRGRLARRTAQTAVPVLKGRDFRPAASRAQ